MSCQMFSECTIDNVVYKVGQDVPSLSPCEKCICAAPDVVCSMIKCQPNSGCRILQQSGQCCPEYKCGKLLINIDLKFNTIFDSWMICIEG